MSTPARAQRLPGATTRALIREAAARLLATGSYRDLSVDAVMAEAGLARTLFYRHFDGLPSLVLSLLEDFRAGVLDSGDPADPEFLRRALRSAVDVARRDGPILRAAEDAARDDAVVERAYREFREWVVDTVAAIFTVNVASGLVRAVPDVRATTRALVLMNAAFLVDTFGEHGGADPDAALETLWTVWARVLGLD